MSIYVKTSDGVAEVQDLTDRVSALEYYEAAGGGDICTVAASNVNVTYLYFKRYGKIVTVFGRIGIGSFPGTWSSKKLATIKTTKWLPRTEGIDFPCVNQNGTGFDISIGTDGVITFNQRGVTTTSSSDSWMSGSVVYICK